MMLRVYPKRREWLLARLIGYLVINGSCSEGHAHADCDGVIAKQASIKLDTGNQGVKKDVMAIIPRNATR